MIVRLCLPEINFHRNEERTVQRTPMYPPSSYKSFKCNSNHHSVRGMVAIDHIIKLHQRHHHREAAVRKQRANSQTSKKGNVPARIHQLIHVEVSLQDTLLEGVWLLPAWSSRSGSRNSHGRSRHLAHTLCPVMYLWAARGGRERGSLCLRDGALGSGSKLLRPVEAATFTWPSGNRIVRCSSWL